MNYFHFNNIRQVLWFLALSRKSLTSMLQGNKWEWGLACFGKRRYVAAQIA